MRSTPAHSARLSYYAWGIWLSLPRPLSGHEHPLDPLGHPQTPSDPRRSPQTLFGPSRERLTAEMMCGSRPQSHNPAATLAFGVVLSMPQIQQDLLGNCISDALRGKAKLPQGCFLSLFGDEFGAVTSSFRRASGARLSTSPSVERPHLCRPRNGPAYSVQGMPCARRPLIQRGCLTMLGASGCPCLVRCRDTSIP